MKRCCAIVPAGLPDLAAHAASLLPRDECIAIFAGDAPEDPGGDADCALIMASPANLPRAMNAVLAWRRQRLRTPVLVVADGLAARELGELFVHGAEDFVATPFAQCELASRLHRALGVSRSEIGCEAAHWCRPPGFIGANPAFLAQLDKLPAYAACDAGVLIGGETGTGKEIFAQALHYLSSRADRGMVAVNCGAIPLELIEVELFGHVKGAYTTAHASRMGLVAEAEGGTLFLDDVDCLPLAAQAKLLRFLQEREYRCIGSNTVHRANVRVVAASNLDLAERARDGVFRQDLYYRLNVLSIQLPPLRARPEDIRPLAMHFIERFNATFDRHVVGIEPGALRRLVSHHWPGNVRELQHVIERAVLLARGSLLASGDIEVDGAVEPDDVADSYQFAKDRVVKQFERAFIERMLVVHAGNITHAARAARKNRRAFFELMRKHHIEPKRFRDATS